MRAQGKIEVYACVYMHMCVCVCVSGGWGNQHSPSSLHVSWRDESVAYALLPLAPAFYLCDLCSLSVNGESMEHHSWKCL